MDKLIVEGGRKLKGEVVTSGAKNAALPILAATLLTDKPCVLKNVPNLKDVSTMVKILRTLGVEVKFKQNVLNINPNKYKGHRAPYKLVSTMRASICVLGPLLAHRHYAEVSLPGGCIIGPRPIDLHLKGLKILGAKIKILNGYIISETERLKGKQLYLGGAFGSSVLATANIMMAATLAKGKTVIENAACEPEVVDLAEFLIKMGAKISGQRSHTIEIEGVEKLEGAEHTLISDRIEAGTYMIAAAITGGDILIKNACFSHLGAAVDKLGQCGVNIVDKKEGIRVYTGNCLKPIDVTTLPYPGFPTDMQAQLMALMSVVPGISIVTEKIYPRRFMHVSELNRMGAQINLEGPSAIVKGVEQLNAAPVMASDLRASAALVLAALAAKGRSEIFRIYHLDRGYENLEEKLLMLGAKIKREKE